MHTASDINRALDSCIINLGSGLFDCIVNSPGPQLDGMPWATAYHKIQDAINVTAKTGKKFWWPQVHIVRTLPS